MTTSLGRIDAFDAIAEEWSSYTERLQHYFIANGIDNEEKMFSIFLTVCGPAIYQLIRDLLSPAAPTTKSFAELVALVKEHQQPPPSFIVQRYHFYTRVQQPGESLNEFMAQLRKLPHHCQFGMTLEDMLRDRLVCGFRDKRLQYKLLADKALTYETAIQIAQSSETAEKGAKDLAGGACGSSFNYNYYDSFGISKLIL